MLKPLALGVLLSLLIASTAAETLVGKVIGVTDGDTVTILSALNEQHKIRVAGIDAPEKAQAFGQRSKQMMADLVFGKHVSVDWSKRDRYQRIIGKVMVADKDAGLALLSAGLAWHYKKYEKEQSSEDRTEYAAAEEAAKAKRLSLWGDADPVPPWEFRAVKRSFRKANKPISLN